MANDGKCSHETCSCSVTGDSEYCSDHCREAEKQDLTEITCDCGHGGCGA
jgi:hypothetical protein